MSQENSRVVLDKISKFSKVSIENLRVEIDQEQLFVRVVGKLPGASADYAYRRRQRLLSTVRKEAKAHNVELTYSFFASDAYSDFEDEMRSVLFATAGGREASMAIRKSGHGYVRVAITGVQSTTIDSARRSLEEVCRRFQIKPRFLNLGSSPNSTKGNLSVVEGLGVYLVRVISEHAPVTADEIADLAGALFGSDLDRTLVNRDLDRLRRNAVVLRSPGGSYSLLRRGLDSVRGWPGRSSPDVRRALALGRRFK